MKDGVMIVNTGRGALVDTKAVIDGLKSGRVGHLGLDVYEEEAELFFEDRSSRVLQDDVFARLLTFPNVLVTATRASSPPAPSRASRRRRSRTSATSSAVRERETSFSNPATGGTAQLPDLSYKKISANRQEQEINPNCENRESVRAAMC